MVVARVDLTKTPTETLGHIYIFPGGKAIMTFPRDLSPTEKEAIARTWERWRESKDGLLVIAMTEGEIVSRDIWVNTDPGYVVYDGIADEDVAAVVEKTINDRCRPSSAPVVIGDETDA